MKKTIIAFTSGLILLAPVLVFARWGNSCWSDSSMPWRGGWFGHNFFGGGMFIFLGTILLFGIAAFFGYNYFKSKKFTDLKSENPFDILKVRYAKGEISKDEFERVRNDIK